MKENTVKQADQAQATPLLLFVCDEHEVQRMQEQITRLGHAAESVQRGGIRQAIQWCAAQIAPKVLVVDIEGDSNYMQSLTELMELIDPACQLIVMGNAQDVNLYRTLLRSGVFDYLARPFSFDLLADTLNRAQDTKESAATATVRSGRTIAVAGINGGVGTSTLAAGLAQILANQRHMQTAVVDFNRHNGCQGMLLGHDDDAGLGAVLAASEIDARFLQRSMAQVDERLALLAQQPDFAADESFSIEHVLTIGAALCRLYNQVIWDLPTAGHYACLDILSCAQIRILVTDLTLQSARNCHRVLQRIGSEHSGQQLLLVANESRESASRIIDKAQFESFLGRKLDLVLPYAAQVPGKSLLNGPLNFTGADQFQQALQQLADLACGQRLQPQSANATLVTRLARAFKRQRTAA